MLRKYFILLPIFCLLAGYALRGAPYDPDIPFPVTAQIGTFLITLFVVSSTMAWGRVLLHRLGQESLGFLGCAMMGSALVVGLVICFGYSGWIHYRHSFLMIGSLLLGSILYGVFFFKGNLRSSVSEVLKKELQSSLWSTGPLWILAALVIGTRGLKAFVPHGTTDPFLYHLLGPRLWTDIGQITTMAQHPITNSCWYWEYFYVAGNLLLGGEGGAGLIEGHLFGQWIHVFGLAIAMMASYRLVLVLTQNPTQAFLGASILGGSFELTSLSWLAKNDIGAMAWTLAAGSLLLDPKSFSGTRIGIAGLWVGLALGNKPNAFFPLLFFALLYLWKISKPIQWKTQGLIIAKVIGIGLLTLSPLFARNWIETDNPFSPFDSPFFSNHLFGPTIIQNYNIAYTAQFFVSLDAVWEKVLKWTLDHPFLGVLGILLPLSSIGIRPLRAQLPLWLATLFSASWFLLISFRDEQIRWFGVSLILLPLMGVLHWHYLSHQLEIWLLPKLKGTSIDLSKAGLFIAVILGFLTTFPNVLKNFRWDSFKHGAPLYVQAVRNESIQVGGASKAWLRLNSQADDLIVSTGDNWYYYISHLHVLGLRESPEIDQLTYGVRDPQKLVEVLSQRGVRWILDSFHWKTVDPRRPTAWGLRSVMFNHLSQQFPNAIAFQGPKSRVIDLPKLALALKNSESGYLGPKIDDEMVFRFKW